ncbi:uncharacterized protein LOC122093555 [Macadamia integrifolia]|uniref:uncharacterized protein LOC122093555 n=1 Tax=Macadamia integrifolia TaxID=60698 RepID=UPI001C530183|nr:uncharacterized protein LOC122093555 [Macadamia integrifolia]
METNIVVGDSLPFKIEKDHESSSHSELKTEEKRKVPKILVSKINLDEIKKASPLVTMTPTRRGRLQKQSSVKLNCLCSPTTHVGSFRCRHHRNSSLSRSGVSVGSNLSELAAKSAASIGNSLQAQ